MPGFLCPVHTPDGSPCGLLNHLSRTCRIVTAPLTVKHIPTLLATHGMTQVFIPSISGRKNMCVQLDGRIIGWARPSIAARLAKNLRIWKTEGKHDIPLDLEIGLVLENKGGQYPGLFLFSNRSRMMRPVKYLLNGLDDQIGSFEQVYMDIACLPEEIDKSSTHVEHDPTNFLSILANLTPFSDFNQVCFLDSRIYFSEFMSVITESSEHLSVSGKSNVSCFWVEIDSVNLRWANKPWVLRQQLSNIGRITNCIDSRPVRALSYDLHCTTLMPWILTRMELMLSLPSSRIQATTWKTP